MAKSLHIAFILDAFPCLSEKFVIDQITSLLDRGHDIQIFAVSDSGENLTHDSVQKYNLLARTHYRPAPPASKPAQYLKAMVLWIKLFFRSPHAAICSIPVLWKNKNASAFKFFSFVSPFFNQSFDLIHAHFGPAGLRALCLKEIFPKVPLVTSFHGYDITTYINKTSKDVYQRLFQKGDAFTYNSDATKKILLELACPEKRMHKIPMGIHPDEFPFKPRTLQPDAPINILSVGRLVEMKGREYAIRAVAQILPQFPRLKYHIVGDGPLRTELNQLIHELKAEKQIILHGRVSSLKLRELYDQAHLFLHPSVTASDGNMEGQGVVLIEAQAAGLPVLATRHNAFPDSLLENQSGFLVPEKDVQSLTEKLLFLLNHPDQWPGMGQAGRQFARENFDMKILSEKLEHLYQQLLP